MPADLHFVVKYFLYFILVTLFVLVPSVVTVQTMLIVPDKFNIVEDYQWKSYTEEGHDIYYYFIVASLIMYLLR
jgi:hypothetical protein